MAWVYKVRCTIARKKNEKWWKSLILRIKRKFFLVSILCPDVGNTVTNVWNLKNYTLGFKAWLGSKSVRFVVVKSENDATLKNQLNFLNKGKWQQLGCHHFKSVSIQDFKSRDFPGFQKSRDSRLNNLMKTANFFHLYIKMSMNYSIELDYSRLDSPQQNLYYSRASNNGRLWSALFYSVNRVSS